ncbi:hypothetical protein [Cyclobacterium amurskyense]|uniref:Uncharacterized protein n=1 Tax=Cyclobacterium amurskyense TaxID=320787 RepID=A0A0H4PFB6_9BACT|nr:hypothetical protein [Cyclobacterium amurskyense]AKP51488.1 hypothetical protein CA2015_2064 [Cyclobacterium amurskyense]
MESKNKELWKKYWEGETSLEEEKTLFAEVEEDKADSKIAEFFSGIQMIRSEKPSGIQLPLPKQRFPWQKLAAVMLVLLTVTACWWGYKEYEQQQQAEAYQQVVEAMGKIKLNLKKGTSQLESMEKIKYLNSGMDWYDNNKNN